MTLEVLRSTTVLSSGLLANSFIGEPRKMRLTEARANRDWWRVGCSRLHSPRGTIRQISFRLVVLQRRGTTLKTSVTEISKNAWSE
jgi:hypothetical protein